MEPLVVTKTVYPVLPFCQEKEEQGGLHTQRYACLYMEFFEMIHDWEQRLTLVDSENGNQETKERMSGDFFWGALFTYASL